MFFFNNYERKNKEREYLSQEFMNELNSAINSKEILKPDNPIYFYKGFMNKFMSMSFSQLSSYFKLINNEKDLKHFENMIQYQSLTRIRNVRITGSFIKANHQYHLRYQFIQPFLLKIKNESKIDNYWISSLHLIFKEDDVYAYIELIIDDIYKIHFNEKKQLDILHYSHDNLQYILSNNQDETKDIKVDAKNILIDFYIDTDSSFIKFEENFRKHKNDVFNFLMYNARTSMLYQVNLIDKEIIELCFYNNDFKNFIKQLSYFNETNKSNTLSELIEKYENINIKDISNNYKNLIDIYDDFTINELFNQIKKEFIDDIIELKYLEDFIEYKNLL